MVGNDDGGRKDKNGGGIWNEGHSVFLQKPTFIVPVFGISVKNKYIVLSDVSTRTPTRMSGHYSSF